MKHTRSRRRVRRVTRRKGAGLLGNAWNKCTGALCQRRKKPTPNEEKTAFYKRWSEEQEALKKQEREAYEAERLKAAYEAEMLRRPPASRRALPPPETNEQRNKRLQNQQKFVNIMRSHPSTMVYAIPRTTLEEEYNQLMKSTR